MMKYVFALALLHLCHSVISDFTLNSEMIGHLDKLSNFSKFNKVNFTSPANVSVPGPYMNDNPASCVGVFKNKLRHLLDSITVQKDGVTVVQKLRANLGKLREPANTDTRCVMKHQSHKIAFAMYKKFLRKLNSRR